MQQLISSCRQTDRHIDNSTDKSTDLTNHRTNLYGHHIDPRLQQERAHLDLNPSPYREGISPPGLVDVMGIFL